MMFDALPKTYDGDFELDCALLSLGKRPVILCIGSDRVTGDALGPIVGQMLVERNVDAFVYGTLDRPVTALNLRENVRHIRSAHTDKKVLAIDSSVGKLCDVGKIRVAFGAIAPGSADGKKLPKVGDVSITATVTDLSKTPLSAVRLGTVYPLAVDITERILRALQ
ncbi:MAG: spore protease YyaC [Clostridiales bacterium]|nr:spore protease YyaC [Clostridiales bacterium]